MYVCICNEVTERDIHDAVEKGASSLRHLRQELKVASCCGNCADTAKKCLQDGLKQQYQANRLVCA